MSKIAEQKALEAYPIDIIPDDDTMGFTSSDRNEVIRLGYTKGYDQAMQDFMEKAELWIEKHIEMFSWIHCDENGNEEWRNNFKNYIKNEM